MEQERPEASRFSFSGEESHQLWWLKGVHEIQDVVGFIAKGGQGAVFRAIYKPQNQGKVATHEQFQTLKVALKITVIPDQWDERSNGNALKSARREIENTRMIMERRLPNVVTFYAAADNRNEKSNTYRSYIIMEMASADLSSLKNKSIFMRADLCYQACLGLKNLHDLNIYHRDIKPPNYLIKRRKGQMEHYDAKLTDMGCSRHLNDTENIYTIVSQTIVGTAFYLAPEVKKQDQKNKNFRSQDVYSFCLLLLEMLYGLKEDNDTGKIVNCGRDLKKEDFMRKPWITIPSNLPNAELLLNCIFKGLKYDSGQRMGDLEELLSILKTYQGFQEKKCRFTHDKYYEEIMCLTKNPNIENIDNLLWENDLMAKEDDTHPEMFGTCVISAVVKTGYAPKKCVLKLSKARTQRERENLWRYIQQCLILKEIYEDKLVKIYDKPQIYTSKKTPSGFVSEQIKSVSRIEQGDCLLGFVIMEAGARSLNFNYEERLKILENMMLPEENKANPDELQLISQRKALNEEKTMLKKQMSEYALNNRLHLCYKVLEIINACHKRNISVGAISTRHIMLFLTDTTFTPKVTKLECFTSQCTLQHKLNDFIQFYYFFLELVYNIIKPGSGSTHTVSSEEQEHTLKQKIVYFENYIRELLNSNDINKTTHEFATTLTKQLGAYSRFEPNTYADTPLESCLYIFSDLKRRIKRAEPLSGYKSSDYRILYEHDSTLMDAHIDVFDLAEITDPYQRAIIENQIQSINIVKKWKFKGILEYYEAVYDPTKRFAYILSEDYREKCEYIQENKKKGHIRSEDLINNFKDILIDLNRLHRMGISHMNIIPKNFYIVGNSQFTIKLGGFDFAWTAESKCLLFPIYVEEQQHIRFKPPEYFRPGYTADMRFASDVWMFGTSFVMFAAGEDALPTVNEVKQHGQPIPLKSKVKNETLTGIFVEKVRDELLRSNWLERGDREFINNFLRKNLDYRTVAPGKNETANQNITRNISYLQDIVQVMENLNNSLEYYLISHEDYIKGYIMIYVAPEFPENDETNKDTRVLANDIRSIPTIHYPTYVNSWLYMLTFIEIYCLKTCIDAIDQSIKYNPLLSDPRTKLKNRLSVSGIRLSNYHSYLERFEPDLSQASRTLENKEIFKRFKDKLLVLFLLFRKYAIETTDQFTEDDILLLQTLHMTYTVEDYLRLYTEQKPGKVTKHSDLQRMPLRELVKRVDTMLRQEFPLWKDYLGRRSI